MDPLVTKTIAIGFGVLLLVAARHKLVTRAEFRGVLLDYRLLPAALVPAIAWFIIGAELAIGCAWLLGGIVPSIIPASATTLLLTSYTLAIAINLLRGRVHISCGCGLSAAAGQPLSFGLVLRNCVLIGVAVAAAFPGSDRELLWPDYLTLAAAVSAATLLYSASAQLLNNSAAIGTWRNARD